MAWSSTGIDLTQDGRRLASLLTNRQEGGQFDVLVTGAEDTRFHFFTEPRQDGNYDLGAILTDRGEKPERRARIRSSTEGRAGELGRIRVREGGEECDFVLTHGRSALTAADVPTLDYTKRQEVELPSGSSGNATFSVRYSFGQPEAAAGATVASVHGRPRAVAELPASFKRHLGQRIGDGWEDGCLILRRGHFSPHLVWGRLAVILNGLRIGFAKVLPNFAKSGPVQGQPHRSEPA